ncbi:MULTISPECIES: nitroreductase [Mameliella]|uniref:Putative oxidoreductase protein n=1 Tax=Mameliella alba TaxID=561184 RepID=A0A0B3RYZ7_9RHOB|nr:MULTISPECIES: nitroreductase [Mameliella]KHQ53322.1 putative oxidoreductase protein [Mameliella alba]MCR9275952.1 nitroreductase [Paracoccaceae bacterium]OWV61167.1 oxidoreductase [Mameliella alba]
MTGAGGQHLLSGRRSVRGFLPDPVPRQDVERILTVARTAPSGANLQPGRFHALTGGPLADLSQALVAAAESGRPPVAEYSYFPQPMPPDLKAKQRAAGYALYSALGIGRRDIAARKAQFNENYRFFSAPVGIVVTIRPDMGKGCFMDLGMSMMALMIAASDLGYATCGIGALANHADIAHAQLGLGEDEMVVCGMALGRADPEAPVNGVRTERDALSVFATLRGFS